MVFSCSRSALRILSTEFCYREPLIHEKLNRILKRNHELASLSRIGSVWSLDKVSEGVYYGQVHSSIDLQRIVKQSIWLHLISQLPPKLGLYTAPSPVMPSWVFPQRVGARHSQHRQYKGNRGDIEKFCFIIYAISFQYIFIETVMQRKAEWSHYDAN